MVVLLNGAFGIGKTTVAHIAARMFPGTRVFDPELAGIALQRALRLAGRDVEDFQDIVLWRRLTTVGIRATAKISRHVIVPMAFSNLAYLREVRSGVAEFETNFIHLCLVAPLEVVYERLRQRGDLPGDPRSAWQYRRSAECCLAHDDSAFGEHISTADLTAREVALQVVERMRRTE